MKRSLQGKEKHFQELQNSLQSKEEQDDIKRKLQEQQDEMQRQLQTNEMDLKQMIVELEHNLEGRIPFHFVMPNFAKLKANSTEWYSPPFYTHHGGYRLSLRVEANGYASLKGKYVSWCLYTEPGEYDDLLKWPRHGPKCYVQILNHCTGKWEQEVCCSTGTFNKPAPAHQCIDCWHYPVVHSDLEYNAQKNTRYLNNDCLHFRITKIELFD